MLISLVSAKGSPGVTTTAATLTAMASEATGGRALLAELDPAGGDIEPLTGLTGEPMLLQAATDMARGLHSEALGSYAVEAPPGVNSLLAPTSGLAAAAMISSAQEHWGPTLSAYDGIVFADCGRWEQSQATARRLAGSDVVAIVCRPTQISVEHVRHLVDPLRQLARPVAVITVGDRPYSLAEVAAALDVHPAGTISWDPKGAGSLWVEGMVERRFRSWSGSWLARSARQVLTSLIEANPSAVPAAVTAPPREPDPEPALAGGTGHPGEYAAALPPREPPGEPQFAPPPPPAPPTPPSGERPVPGGKHSAPVRTAAPQPRPPEPQQAPQPPPPPPPPPPPGPPGTPVGTHQPSPPPPPPEPPGHYGEPHTANASGSGRTAEYSHLPPPPPHLPPPKPRRRTILPSDQATADDAPTAENRLGNLDELSTRGSRGGAEQ